MYERTCTLCHESEIYELLLKSLVSHFGSLFVMLVFFVLHYAICKRVKIDTYTMNNAVDKGNDAPEITF